MPEQSKERALVWLKRLFWAMAALILGILAVRSFYLAMTASGDRASWWQVGLEAVAFLPILYQLDQIRQAIVQKPMISIGLATVNDLPLSKIREKESLPTTVRVSRGYAHFYLVVCNQGKVGAKFVKIHLEHKRPDTKPQSVLFPVVEISEFSDDKPSFTQENNIDFVFIGGSEWSIYPNDTEIFGFHITTVVVKQKEPHEIREFPEPGDCLFHCTVWAEGLDHPVKEQLMVKIKE